MDGGVNVSSDSFVRHARSLRSLVTNDCRNPFKSFFSRPSAHLSAFRSLQQQRAASATAAQRRWFDNDHHSELPFDGELSHLNDDQQASRRSLRSRRRRDSTDDNYDYLYPNSAGDDNDDEKICRIRQELGDLVAAAVDNISLVSPAHGDILQYLLTQVDTHRNDNAAGGAASGSFASSSSGAGGSSSDAASSTSAANGSDNDDTDNSSKAEEDEGLRELRQRYPKRKKSAAGKAPSAFRPLTPSEKALYIILKTSPALGGSDVPSSTGGSSEKQFLGTHDHLPQPLPPLAIDPKCPSHPAALRLIEVFNLRRTKQRQEGGGLVGISASSSSSGAGVGGGKWSMLVDPIVGAAIQPAAVATTTSTAVEVTGEFGRQVDTNASSHSLSKSLIVPSSLVFGENAMGSASGRDAAFDAATRGESLRLGAIVGTDLFTSPSATASHSTTASAATADGLVAVSSVGRAAYRGADSGSIEATFGGGSNDKALSHHFASAIPSSVQFVNTSLLDIYGGTRTANGLSANTQAQSAVVSMASTNRGNGGSWGRDDFVPAFAMGGYTAFDAIRGVKPPPPEASPSTARGEDWYAEDDDDDDDCNANNSGKSGLFDDANLFGGKIPSCGRPVNSRTRGGKQHQPPTPSSAVASPPRTAFSFFEHHFRYGVRPRGGSDSGGAAISREALTILHISLHYVAVGLPDPFGVVVRRPIPPHRSHGWLSLADDLVTLSNCPQLRARGAKVPIRNIIAPLEALCHAGNMCHRLSAVAEAGKFLGGGGGGGAAGGSGFSSSPSRGGELDTLGAVAVGSIGTAAMAALRHCLRLYTEAVGNGGSGGRQGGGLAGHKRGRTDNDEEGPSDIMMMGNRGGGNGLTSHRFLHDVTPDLYLDTAAAIADASDVFCVLADIFGVTLARDWRPQHSVRHCASAVFLSKLHSYAVGTYQQSHEASRVATIVLRFVTAPLTQMMAAWAFHGALRDANAEFFIECTTTTTTGSDGWQNKKEGKQKNDILQSAVAAEDAVVERFSVNLDPLKIPTSLVSEDTAFDILCAGLARRVLEGCVHVMMSPYAEEHIRGELARRAYDKNLELDRQRRAGAEKEDDDKNRKGGGFSSHHASAVLRGRDKMVLGISQWVKERMEEHQSLYDDYDYESEEGDNADGRSTATTRRSGAGTTASRLSAATSRRSFLSLAKSRASHHSKIVRGQQYGKATTTVSGAASRAGGNAASTVGGGVSQAGRRYHTAHHNKPTTFNYKPIIDEQRPSRRGGEAYGGHDDVATVNNGPADEMEVLRRGLVGSGSSSKVPTAAATTNASHSRMSASARSQKTLGTRSHAAASVSASTVAASSSVFAPQDEDDTLFDAILIDYLSALRGEHPDIGPPPPIEASGAKWRAFFIRCEALLYGEEISVPEVDDDALNVLVSHHLLLTKAKKGNGEDNDGEEEGYHKSRLDKSRRAISGTDEFGNLIILYNSGEGNSNGTMMTDDDENNDHMLDALSEIVHAAGRQGGDDLAIRNSEQQREADEEAEAEEAERQRRLRRRGERRHHRVRFDGFDDDDNDGAATSQAQQDEAVSEQALREAEMAELKEIARLQMLMAHEEKMRALHWQGCMAGWRARRARHNNRRAVAIATDAEECRRALALRATASDDNADTLHPMPQRPSSNVQPLVSGPATKADVIVSKSRYVPDSESGLSQTDNGSGGADNAASTALRRITGGGEEALVDNPHPEFIISKTEGDDGKLSFSVPAIGAVGDAGSDDNASNVAQRSADGSANGDARTASAAGLRSLLKSSTVGGRKHNTGNNDEDDDVAPFDPLKSLKEKQRKERELRNATGGGAFWNDKLVVGDEEDRKRDLEDRARERREKRKLKQQGGGAVVDVDAATSVASVSAAGGEGGRTIVSTAASAAHSSKSISASKSITTPNENEGEDGAEDSDGSAAYEAQHKVYSINDDAFADLVGYRRFYHRDEALKALREDFDRRERALLAAALPVMVVQRSHNDSTIASGAAASSSLTQPSAEALAERAQQCRFIDEQLRLTLLVGNSGGDLDTARSEAQLIGGGGRGAGRPSPRGKADATGASTAAPIVRWSPPSPQLSPRSPASAASSPSSPSSAAIGASSNKRRRSEGSRPSSWGVSPSSSPGGAASEIRLRGTTLETSDDVKDGYENNMRDIRRHVEKWNRQNAHLRGVVGDDGNSIGLPPPPAPVTGADLFAGQGGPTEEVPVENLPSVLLRSHIASFGKFVCNYYSQKALQFLLLPQRGPIRQLIQGLHDVLLLQNNLLADTLLTAWSPTTGTASSSSSFDVNATFSAFYVSFQKAWAGTDASYWAPLTLSVASSSSDGGGDEDQSAAEGSINPTQKRLPRAKSAFDLLPHIIIEPPTAERIQQLQLYNYHVDHHAASSFAASSASAFPTASAASAPTNGMRSHFARYREFLSILPSQAIERYGDVFVSLVFWRWVRELLSSLWYISNKSAAVKEVWSFTVLARGVLFVISDFIWFRVQSESSQFLRQLFANDGKSYAQKASLDALTDDIDGCLERVFTATLLAPPFARARRQARALVRVVEDVHETLSNPRLVAAMIAKGKRMAAEGEREEKRGSQIAGAAPPNMSLAEYIRAKTREFTVATDALIRHLDGASSMGSDATITQMTSMVAALRAAIQQR